ncbi:MULTISPECIES: hypothetical protein [Proteus]|uniref:Uncharacterized protein n=1 Tax=Proteus penneri TaxID=102862 RepID=A0ABS0VYM3_9GAMM|nr:MULTISPECIES: hypothetical protein [Proteus]MBJ2116148.1 hypothetical protein [Proteus penneri]NBM97234.1 hypothetical protein [Proteus sp. G2660]QPT34307.1 hypothetical protein I6G31_02500 [Proteus penneri]
MDILSLKELLRPEVGNLNGHCTHQELPEFFRQLGLPISEDSGSKRERLYSAFDLLDDAELPRFAEKLLAQQILNERVRNQIQDLLWEDELSIEISKRHRRELATVLQPLKLFSHWENFKQLINDIFIIPVDLSSMFLIPETGIWAEIERRFVKCPEHADIEWLFDELGVVELSHPRFRRWLFR